MKTFEQPLTLEEEAQYLRIMYSDDIEAAEMARQTLIERNLRLVAHVAKKYVGNGEEMEDLISIGTIGLIKAINTFKPDKGNRLGTYAAKCIDNELLMKFRTRKKITKEISLYEPIGTDKEGNEINLLDICVQEQKDIVEEMDISEKIKCLKVLMNEVLDDREKEVINLRYGVFGEYRMSNETTQKDIGKMLGISRSYVSRIEKKALSKLKKGLMEAKLE